MPRISTRLFPAIAGLALFTAFQAAHGCAYNATGVLPRPTLIFEASVEGQQLTQANNIAYYFVLDTSGKTNTDTGPFVNGPAPLTHPYPDPRSYLPFVRDEKDILDREPVAVPNTEWTDYFWLTENAGTMEMWQARRNADGTINERFRQLQNGREWGMKDPRTIQITVPFNQLSFADPNNPPPQFKANLAVATRALANQSRGFVIERWGRVQNTFFNIQTHPINQNFYDSVSGVTFPNNVPQGMDPASMNFVSITYRVTLSE